jgi:hypothetical protein
MLGVARASDKATARQQDTATCTCTSRGACVCVWGGGAWYHVGTLLCTHKQMDARNRSNTPKHTAHQPHTLRSCCCSSCGADCPSCLWTTRKADSRAEGACHGACRRCQHAPIAARRDARCCWCAVARAPAAALPRHSPACAPELQLCVRGLVLCGDLPAGCEQARAALLLATARGRPRGPVRCRHGAWPAGRPPRAAPAAGVLFVCDLLPLERACALTALWNRATRRSSSSNQRAHVPHWTNDPAATAVGVCTGALVWQV